MSGTSGIPSWAVKGARVVCVDNRPAGCPVNPHPPLGTRLVISGVLPDNVWGGGVCLVISGYPNPSEVFAGVEMGWRIARFRPLVSDTDELGIETVLYRAKGLKSKVPARQKEPTA